MTIKKDLLVMSNQPEEQINRPPPRDNPRHARARTLPQPLLVDLARGMLNPDRLEQPDLMGDITKKVRVEVPDFLGKIDPRVFCDWLATMDDYFEWYEMTEDRKVRFAKMKLIGHAKVVKKC